MTRKASEPLQHELYAAYKAGVNLNYYVLAYGITHDHDAAMAVIASRAKDDDMHWHLGEVRKRFDTGMVKGRNVGEAVRKGLSVQVYMDFAAYSGLSHDVIIDAMRCGVTYWDYGTWISHGVTTEQLKQYCREFGGSGNGFYYYVTIRHKGVATDVARRLVIGSHFGDDTVRLLDAGVTSAELIEMIESDAVRREAEVRDLQLLSSRILETYRDVRLEAAYHQINVSHEEARELSEGCGTYWHVDYMRHRKRKGGTHERALRSSRIS